MKTLIAAAAAAYLASATLAAGGALAQTDPKEDIRQAVQRALIPVLGSDAGALVERISRVVPDGAISRNFDPVRVVGGLFPRGAVAAADCRVQTTAAGEPETAGCTYASGRIDDPTGAYSALTYSRNIGLGHIRFVRRAAFAPGSTAEPAPVRLSDVDAHKQAQDFVAFLGLPAAEIPQPPTLRRGAMRATLPVRTLAVGAGIERTGSSRIPVQKVVSFQRAFKVPGGLFQDAATGIVVEHVLAPGSATVVLDDGGVQFARVDGWSDAQMDRQAVPALAKTVGQLTDEITDDLYNEGVRKVGALSLLVTLRRAMPHPDDPNPPPCSVCGLLRPAVQVAVSQVGGEPVATSERDFVAPGLVREYDLVEMRDTDRPAR